jgi:hypothetical protein
MCHVRTRRSWTYVRHAETALSEGSFPASEGVLWGVRIVSSDPRAQAGEPKWGRAVLALQGKIGVWVGGLFPVEVTRLHLHIKKVGFQRGECCVRSHSGRLW